MKDHELIMLASQSMGYEINHTLLSRCIVTNPRTGWGGTFAPLTSHSDCARMEGELKINIDWQYNYIRATAYIPEKIESVELYGTDRHAARMRASTRVAAGIQERKTNA